VNLGTAAAVLTGSAISRPARCGTWERPLPPTHLRRFWKGTTTGSWLMGERLSGSPISTARPRLGGHHLHHRPDGLHPGDRASATTAKHKPGNGEGTTATAETTPKQLEYGVGRPIATITPFTALRTASSAISWPPCCSPGGADGLLMERTRLRRSRGAHNTWCQKQSWLDALAAPMPGEFWPCVSFVQRCWCWRRKLAACVTRSALVQGKPADPQASHNPLERVAPGSKLERPTWGQLGRTPLAWSLTAPSAERLLLVAPERLQQAIPLRSAQPRGLVCA